MPVFDGTYSRTWENRLTGQFCRPESGIVQGSEAIDEEETEVINSRPFSAFIIFLGCFHWSSCSRVTGANVEAKRGLLGDIKYAVV